MRERVLRVPRATVTALLAVLFALAFVVTPYWTVAQSLPARALILLLTIAAGIGWLALVGSDIPIRLNVKKWGNFAIVFFFLLALNFKYLTSAIAWRGDEHFHIENTLALVTRISATGLLASLIVAGLILSLSWYKPKWALLVGGTTIIFWVVFILVQKPFDEISPVTLLRYPFLNYWFFSLAPKIYSVISTPFQEYLYRIVPFMAIVGVVYLVWSSIAAREIYFRILWLAVLGTIPILSYYASILYLEPFAVLLVVIVCLRAQFLPGENVDQVKRDIGWYALITVGFVKETAFIFLACFLVVRLITRWLHRNRESLSNDEIKPRVDWWISTFIDALKQEIAVITSLLLPLLIYLWLRFQFLETRSFAPNPAILADGQIYPVIARSVWEQFGGMIFLFFGGLGVFVWRKEYRSAIFFLLLFIAYPLFHAIDSQSYVGYSRFNLFLSGPILASSVVFINRVASQKKIFGALLGVALLAINILYSPLLPDGTKKSHWGIYLSGISEEYYPYQEAFDWLEQEHRNSKILFAGFNYPYPFEFYFAKYNWNPPYRTLLVNGAMNETETLNDAVEKADLREMNVIVFHVLENEAALPFRVGDFEQEKTIRNLSHSIVVYNKFSKEK